MPWATRAQPFTARYFSISQGMPSQAVYNCVQDKRGFLWIATENGIARFDGFQFRHYGIADGLLDSDILSVLIDSTGTVWALPFQKAPVYYDDSTDSFHPLKTLFEKDFRSYRGFVLSDTDVAISDIHGQTYVIDSRDRQITDSLYFSALVNHLFKFDQQTYGVLLPKKYLLVRQHRVIAQKSLPFYVRFSLAQQSTLYCGNHNRLLKIDANTGKILRIRRLPFAIRQIDKAPLGIYVTSLQGEVYLLDTVHLRLQQKIWQNGSVNEVYDPGKGLVWISTKEQGLIMLRSQQISSILQQVDPQAANWNAVLATDDNIIAGNNHGEIFIQHGQYIHKVALTTSLNIDAWIRDIFYNKPYFLIVSQLGLYQFKPGKRLIHIFPQYQGFKTAARLNDSTYFLGTHGKLFLCYYHQGIYHLQTLHTGKRITAIAPISAEECYVGSEDGVYHFLKGQMIKLNIDGRIGQQKIHALAIDQRKWIWVAYGGDSLLAFHRGKLMLAIRTGEHFPGNIIKCLYADGNYIWVGTNNCLGKIQVVYRTDVHVQTTFFSLSDGLAGNQINDIEKNRGRLYVATSNGISYFPDTLSIPATDIPVYIMGIHAGKKHFTGTENIHPVFSYRENHVRIDLAAVDYSGLPGVWFRYKLNEHKWVISKDPTVYLYELPPGNYTFFVQAIRRDGLPSAWLTRFSFEIQAPFFVKPIFWITLLSILFITAGTITWQTLRKKHQRRIKELEQQKKLMDLEMQMMRAQVNPHFIFNTLNAIKQMIYDKEIQQATKYLDKFSAFLRANIYTRQDALISLQQELEYLKQYLELEKLRFGDQFDYQIKVNQFLESMQFQVPALILQPIVENAIKHGIRKLKHQKGYIEVQVTASENICYIRITDNGPGLPNHLNGIEESAEGKGLAITRKRAEWHGIRFYLHTKQVGSETFTEAVFEIPIFKSTVVWHQSIAIS
ncbi:MAG: histidine kinase [Thermoflavifilum sp.]|nr:histidine kinase [Thermoflavifilum sp.]